MSLVIVKHKDLTHCEICETSLKGHEHIYIEETDVVYCRVCYNIRKKSLLEFGRGSSKANIFTKIRIKSHYGRD